MPERGRRTTNPRAESRTKTDPPFRAFVMPSASAVAFGVDAAHLARRHWLLLARQSGPRRFPFSRSDWGARITEPPRCAPAANGRAAGCPDRDLAGDESIGPRCASQRTIRTHGGPVPATREGTARERSPPRNRRRKLPREGDSNRAGLHPRGARSRWN